MSLVPTVTFASDLYPVIFSQFMNKTGAVFTRTNNNNSCYDNNNLPDLDEFLPSQNFCCIHWIII